MKAAVTPPQRYLATIESLARKPKRWLVTGAAGFIGSNLVERLLQLGQDVVGLDSFATGHRSTIEDVVRATRDAPGRFELIEGDIVNLDVCRRVCDGVDFVLHHAALASVPLSIAEPVAAHAVNVSGFVNVLVAARDRKVKRVICASSSAVYGDEPGLPKTESQTARPLSPYAMTKLVNELYADVFQRTYALEIIAFRYFNIFGPRQDPDGPYAAVIPRWITRLLAGKSCEIHGDGETSRDFCYVENVLQTNILAALAPASVTGAVYNVGSGRPTTLNALFTMIRDSIARQRPGPSTANPVYGSFRAGDIRHSHADISKARTCLGYEPTVDAAQGLTETISWHQGKAKAPLPQPAR